MAAIGGAKLPGAPEKGKSPTVFRAFRLRWGGLDRRLLHLGRSLSNPMSGQTIALVFVVVPAGGVLALPRWAFRHR